MNTPTNTQVKKFKQAILHVGPDKTGSTSIQIACDYSRKILIDNGIYYPEGRWHAELGSCFCEIPEEYIFNAQSGFTNRKIIRKRDETHLLKVRQELEQNKADILVLSYEGFVDLDKTSLIRFRNFIYEYAASCEVVFYARSPLSYATSAMSQRVKSGMYSWTIGNPPTFPTKSYLEKLEEVFGINHLIVRKFARDVLPNGDVVLDFLSILNLPDNVQNKVASSATSENPALSAEALLIGERIISLFGNNVPVQGIFYSLFSTMLSEIKGEEIQLNPTQVKEIERVTNSDSDYLVKKFGISFAPELNKIEDMPPLIATKTMDSLAKLLLELKLPNFTKEKILSSPDLELISAVLREDIEITHGQLMTFDVDFILNRKVNELETGVHIFDDQKRWAFGINSTLLGQPHKPLTSGSYCVSYHLIADLPAGKYTAGFAFAEKLADGGQNELAWRDVMCEFEVHHNVSKTFAGYAYLPAEISLSSTRLALPEMVVSQANGRLQLATTVSSMVAGERVNIKVTVINDSEQTWVGDSLRPVKLCYHWQKDTGEMLIFDGLRSDIPSAGFPSDQAVEAEMRIKAPLEAGTYILMLTLLQENISWFEDIGFAPCKLSINITN